MGQPTAIVVILPRPAWPTATAWPIATAKTLSGMQIPTLTIAFTTPATPFRPILVVPIAIPPDTLIAVPLATPTAAFASTFTLLGPPPAQYLYPGTARDRLNYTFNGLAIGPESV